MDARQEGLKKGGMQERRDSKDEGCTFGSATALIKKTTILIYKNQCFFIRRCSFGLFCLLNVLLRNWLLHAKASFAKHEISRNNENFIAKYETCFT